MIAESLKSGRYFDGLSNYQFEGRLLEHKDKNEEILTHSPELLMPVSKEDKEGIEELRKDFNGRTRRYLSLNPECKTNLIGHQVLSFTKADEMKLGKDGINKILDDYIKSSGIDKTMYYAISHNDTKNFHIHITFHKVMNDFKLQNEWRIKNKSIERGIALACDYGLELDPKQRKIALTLPVLQQRVGSKHIDNMRNSMEELKKARNLHHLTVLLDKSNKTYKELPDGSISIGQNKFKKEDLEVCFYSNRQNLKTEKSQGLSKDNEKIHNFRVPQTDEATEKEAKASSKGIYVPKLPYSQEGKPLKRKRKGKSHLLKNQKEVKTQIEYKR